jgi:hypothetical protein
VKTTLPAPGTLIETFTITIPDGLELPGSLYATTRRGGRRVIVRDPEGRAILFDSDDCYDGANAMNKLDNWVGSL